jgi:hypothetical protein
MSKLTEAQLSRQVQGKARYSVAEVAAMMDGPRRVRNVAPRSERTFMGTVFDSKAEAAYAAELHIRALSGDIWFWWRQVKFPLVVNGVKICDFIVDFSVQRVPNGPLEYHEVKGWETPEYKLKLKLFKALYPNADYRVVKV